MEYSILIAVIAVAVTTMYIYAKRGLQGIIRANADQIVLQNETDQFIGAANISTESESLTFVNSSSTVNKTVDYSMVEMSSFSDTVGNSTTTSESF